MQRNHHIDGLAGGVALDVAGEEGEAVVLKLPGHLLTEADHIVLEIETDDLDIEMELLDQVVVEPKGEVALAAAEVDDVDHPVPG